MEVLGRYLELGPARHAACEVRPRSEAMGVRAAAIPAPAAIPFLNFGSEGGKL
jgi:hypothetical protein